MKTYQERKEIARQEAIEYQTIASTMDLCWETIAWETDYFTKLGKRYGLLKEFKENGIL